MALAKPYHRQAQQHSVPRNKSPNAGGSSSPTATDVKRLVNHCMTRLSDRDTEPMAAAELESMARTLPAGSLPSFLSAISDARPSDKTPLRRHSVRLLATLSRAHPPGSLAPLFPRMLSALTRRLRDPDSSVRAACADAAGQIAAAGCPPAVFIRVLSESLLLEQDHNAQIGAAMCLAAAIDESAPADDVDEDGNASNNRPGTSLPDLAPQLLRLLPRLLKLAKADAFKAKPALLTLLGAVAAAGGASTPAAMGLLIPCLNDFLASDDWAARKAAAEALSRVAAIDDAYLLAAFKAACVSSYESRRFDKVKIVRESMNQMLEAWKDLPEEAASAEAKGSSNNVDTQAVHYSATATSANSKDVASDGCFPPASRSASSVKSSNTADISAARKNRFLASRSPPPEASPAPTNRRSVAAPPPTTEKRATNPPLFRKLDRNKKPADWKIEIAVPCGHPVKVVHEGSEGAGVYDNGGFENNKPTNRFAGHLKSRARVVPLLDKESSGSAPGAATADELCMKQKESSELASIHNQLVQIENQQSSLMELLQKFIGSSQDGMHSLETRVRGLEMALDEISQDLAVSGRMGADSFASTCWKLPGAEFLSSRLWRRTEGRYPRFSVSSSSALTGMRASTDKDSNSSSHWDKRQYGIRGGFVVNPLAEVNMQSEISSKRVIRTTMHDSSGTPTRDAKHYDGPSPSTCASTPGMTSRATQSRE